MREGISNPIDRRLVAGVLFFSGVVILILTSIQLYIEYRRNLSEIDLQFRRIDQSFKKPLSEAVWVLDENGIRNLLEGMLQLRDITYLEAWEGGRLVIAAGDSKAPRSIRKVIPLTYRYERKNRHIGNLVVTADLSGVYDRLADRFVLILLVQGMEILLVAGFILLIFRFFVTRHLTAIGEYLKRLDLKTPPEPLVLHRKQHKDELSLTVGAINEMTANLFSAYEEIARELEARKSAEARLKAAYAEVEKRIAERTAALSEAKSKLEAEIREREAVEYQLRQRHKMEAIGTMAGGVAHDFNNILGIIIGYAEITAEDLTHDNPAHGNLREIIDASLRGRDVVKHLIAFTRKGALDRKPVSIADIIRETKQLVRASTSKAVEVRVKTGEDIPAVSGDGNELRQLLLQLAKNAAEAMDAEGGVLTFEAGERNIPPEKAAKLDIEPGPYVYLAVQDTGPGIPPAKQDRIFDPYFTTKDPAVYSGMGLSIVRGIIRRHDGAIDVESVEEGGTTVTVFFRAMRQAVLQPLPEAAPPMGQGEHILLIDDEPALAAVGRQLLETLGYRVETATDPRYALDRFREAPHRFDMVITDMSMPFITGDVLSKKMLSIRANIPILLCTGYSAKIDSSTALAAGIRGYVEKPLNRNELAAAVRSALSASPPAGIQDAGEAKRQV